MIRRVRRTPLLDLGVVDANGTDAPPAPIEPCICGCQPETFKAFTPAVRCDIHANLMRAVMERWTAGTGWERQQLWQESDGLGRRGYRPPGGRFDISAINRSSPEAIERMFRVMIGLGPLDDAHSPLQEESN